MSGFDDIDELDEVAASGLFDAEWYLSRYDDIRASDISPSLHFHRHGWQEGRWPNRYFDPQWYLESYVSDAPYAVRGRQDCVSARRVAPENF